MTRSAEEFQALDATVARAMQEVSRILLEQVDELSDSLVQKILAQEPAYRAEKDAIIDDLTETVMRTTRATFQAIGGWAVEPSLYERNGRSRAASTIPLHAVLHAYRIGGLFQWECFARAASSVPDGDRVIAEGSSYVWHVIELASQSVTQGYRGEIEARQRRSASERAALLKMILNGTFAATSDLWDAAETLALPSTGGFVVAATSTPRPGVEGVADAERALARANLRSAWRVDTTTQVGIVSLSSPASIDRANDVILAAATGPVGLSERFRDLRGAPEALRQAKVAMQTSRSAQPEVIAYADVPLQAMLVVASRSAEQLHRVVLGPILDHAPADSQLLLETLDAWIRSGGSIAACAELLYLHRNSVTRRLQRITELTGWDPQTPEGVAMLYVAREAQRLLPGDAPD